MRRKSEVALELAPTSDIVADWSTVVGASKSSTSTRRIPQWYALGIGNDVGGQAAYLFLHGAPASPQKSIFWDCMMSIGV